MYWVKKNKKQKSFLNREGFSVAFSGILGIISTNLILFIFTALFFGMGYSLIVNNNKEETKLLENLQTKQYLGVGFFVIGLLPWIRYFFTKFLIEA